MTAPQMAGLEVLRSPEDASQNSANALASPSPAFAHGTAALELAFEVPLPHRALAKLSDVPYSRGRRAVQRFEDEVERALCAQSWPCAPSGSPLVVDVAIGIRDARKLGAYWVPQSRRQMLLLAELMVSSIRRFQLASDNIGVGDVSSSRRWGPKLRVTIRQL